MDDIVLTDKSLERLNSGVEKYESVGWFVSNYIYEKEKFEEAISVEVKRRGCQGLVEIQREPIPRYCEKDGRLIPNGTQYLVKGKLIRRVA